MIDNESLPPQDDVQSQGPSEQDLLDAVMANSPIMEEAGVPLPVEEEIEEDPVESDEEVEDPESEEVVSEDDEEVEAEEEEVESADDSSTQSEAYALDDLEEFDVVVKIDGEETSVSIQDLVKGYTTEQSLSKKGRELGEARKALDEERAEKLGEIEAVSAATQQALLGPENAAAKRFHDFEAQIDKARANGDAYEVNELKDKREQAQKQYWQIRQRREQLIEQTAAATQKAKEEEFQQQLTHFQEVIPEMIPDFNEDTAMQIRDFAVEQGIAEDLLDSVVDPRIVKFIDDYRRLKQGVSKGAAKRKAAPTKKALPAKKAKPAARKSADKEKMVKARAFKDGASSEDQMDFLRQYASKSLNQ